MIYLYMYILAVLDTRFYIYDNNDFHVDIYISSREDGGGDTADTFVKLTCPWQDEAGGSQTTVEEFSLGKTSSGDHWRKEYALSLEQWDLLTTAGIRVESTDRLTVQFASGLPGASVLSTYLALPLTEHSTDFYLASYQRRIDVYSPLFIIGAGHKASSITVYNSTSEVILTDTIPENSVREFLANSTIRDTTGFRVTATEPVAVFSGHQCGNVPVDTGFCESFLQQMPPVKSLGTDYVAGPILGIKENTGYTTRAILAHPDTEVSVEYDPKHNTIWNVQNNLIHCNMSNAPATTDRSSVSVKLKCDRSLDPGLFVEIRASNATSPVAFHCSKPCLSTLYNHGSEMYSFSNNVLTDVFMLLTPPLELRNKQARFSTILYKNTSFVNYLNVITDRTTSDSRITMDGEPIENLNVSVLDFGYNSIYALEVPSGVHQIQIHGENVRGMTMQIYGHALVGYLNSYALPIAYMDKVTMGPLPPGDAAFSQSAMVAILASVITLLMITFVIAISGAAFVSYKRRKTRNPLLPWRDGEN